MAAEATAAADLDSPLARAVLTRVQQELPVCERPYAALGAACGATEGEVFAAVEAARAAGIVRRIGASFESSRIGYASTLAALAVAPDDLDRVAALVGAHPGITHNYERDDRRPNQFQWPRWPRTRRTPQRRASPTRGYARRGWDRACPRRCA